MDFNTIVTVEAFKAWAEKKPDEFVASYYNTIDGQPCLFAEFIREVTEHKQACVGVWYVYQDEATMTNGSNQLGDVPTLHNRFWRKVEQTCLSKILVTKSDILKVLGQLNQLN